MKWLLAVLIALSFSAAASAQGLQCRTSPPGASTPYCASEAFVSESRGTLTPQAFASLPACSSTTAGQTAAVTDSTTDTFGATITGGGSFHVLAYCNGTNWTVSGGGAGAGNVTGPSSAVVGHVATYADTSGKVIQDGGVAGTVTEQKDTGSVGIATSGNCDNISSNASSPCDHHLALNNASLQANPSNPTACAAATCPLATGVMAGLGSTCHLTPVYSGRIEVTFYNGVSNAQSGNNNASRVFFGTGTAPANAAAITGTQIGQQQRLVNGGINFIYALSNGGIATGLTPGTAYWFDESQQTDGGTIQLQNVSCTLREY